MLSPDKKYNTKGRDYYTIFLTNFKYSNFDFDKLIYRQNGIIIYVDAYYIPSIQCCPFVNLQISKSLVQKLKLKI